EAGCFNDEPLNTDVNASYDLVNSGEAVAVTQVLASYPQISSTASEDAEFGFFPLPGDDSGDVPMPRGIGVSFAVNEEATNEEAALEFVDWLASPEATEVWFDAAPGLPAMQDSDVELDPVMQAADDLIAEGSGAGPGLAERQAAVRTLHRRAEAVLRPGFRGGGHNRHGPGLRRLRMTHRSARSSPRPGVTCSGFPEQTRTN